jgi:WbqC-like protein family
MVLGLMQPYFFPYLGYFELIDRVDQWIAFDTAQYVRRGWVNRNRVLHPVAGWQYLTVPVRKNHRDTSISEIRIVEDNDWCTRIERQLQHYRGRAPHFESVIALLHDCLMSKELSLARMNVAALRKVCAFLDIPFEWHLLSEMGLRLGPIDGPGDWALRLAETLHADEYVNLPGGRGLYDEAKFAASGIRLTILNPTPFLYECSFYRFERSLSILDVLMWNSPAEVREMLSVRRRCGASLDGCSSSARSGTYDW